MKTGDPMDFMISASYLNDFLSALTGAYKETTANHLILMISGLL